MELFPAFEHYSKSETLNWVLKTDTLLCLSADIIKMGTKTRLQKINRTRRDEWHSECVKRNYDRKFVESSGECCIDEREHDILSASAVHSAPKTIFERNL